MPHASRRRQERSVWRAPVALALVAAVATASALVFQPAPQVRSPSAASTARGATALIAKAKAARSLRAAGTGSPSPGETAIVTKHVARSKSAPKQQMADPKTLIVHFAPDTTTAQIDRSLAAAQATRLSTIDAIGAVEASVSDRSASSAALKKDPNVESVESNRLRYASADPDDQGYADQGHLFVSRLPIAWDVTKGSSTLDVAVIDTGVDLDHPDLAGRIVAGYDFVDNDTSPQDDEGHGTMVAGIAAATTNNGIGVAGVAWNARIIPVKVLGADGGGTDADVANGIVWAATHGAEVINLSLGGPGSSQALTDAVTYAITQGVLVVAAAGNEGSSEPSYPAAINGVLSVGATDLNGDAAVFTNHGPWVDMSAPGTSIVSTALVDGPDEAYAVGDGTSFSAPIVSGAAILVKAKNPSMTASQIASRLVSSAADRGPAGRDDSYGRGLLDAYGAIGGRTAASPPAVAVDASEPNDVSDRATPVTQPLLRTIAPEGDVDWYRYDAAGAGTMTVQVDTYTASTEALGIDATISIYSPDRHRLADVDEQPADGNETATVYAEAAGAFTFAVRSKLGSRSGQYQVSVDFDPHAQAFAPFQAYATQARSEDVAIADVTGDGRNDVIESSGWASDPDLAYRLFVFPQDEDGTLGEPMSYATDGSLWLDTGDLDGDGDADVALSTNNGINVFTQSDGALDGPTMIGRDLAAGHITIADVLSSSPGNEIVADRWGTNDANVPTGTTILGRSDGTWSAVASGLPAIYEPQVGDVSGDGRADIVGLPATTTDKVRVLTQQPDASFVATDHTGSFGYWPDFDDTAIADVTGDGLGDVVATIGGNTPGSRLNIFAQDTNGALGSPETKSSLDAAGSVTAADVNQDGLQDIVVAHGGWNDVGVYYQQAGGGLGAEQLSPIPYASHYAPRGLAVGDIDGSGKPDIAIADYNAGLVVLRQNPVGTATAMLGVRSTTPARLATGISASVHPTATFATSLAPASVTTSTVRLRDLTSNTAVASSVAYVDATKSVTLTPSSALVAGHTYGVTLDGLTDALDGPLGPQDDWRFTIAKPATKPATKSDVNGDGYDDVIAGAPGEDLGSTADAGAIHVLYGSASGTKTTGSVMLTQDSANVPGVAEAGDRFGAAIATGDVNNDGYDDVAVGAPGEDLGTVRDGGLVHLFLGSATGLRTSGSQTWTQDASGIPGSAENADRFGSTLAFGDFDASSGADLAVGSPGESIGSAVGAGAIYAITGTASGLTGTGSRIWTQDAIDGFGASGNAFGASLAAGDFDGDTHSDLVAGAPGEDVSVTDQGTITLFNGTIVGLRPQGSLWSDLITGVGAPAGERFGSALASTDFGGGTSVLDRYDDLAIGAPGDTNGAGRVDVLFSDWIGPGRDVAHVTQETIGSPTEAGDRFGASLAAARTTAGQSGWLAVGTPGEDQGGVTDAGVVQILQPLARAGGNGQVLAPVGEDSAGIPDAAETGDGFGTSVRLLDVDKDGHPDMVVGTPNEGISSAAKAGIVHVVRHADQTLSPTALRIYQGSGGVPGAAEPGDVLGTALGG